MIRPDVIVNLELYSEGGRHGATPSDHLSCIFEYEGENFECRLLLRRWGPRFPADEQESPLSFFGLKFLD